MDPTSFIFVIVVLIMSAVVHEVSHGYMAEHLGDPTARLAGRITLNPLPHLDMVGSFIFPVLLFFLNTPIIFAWAKPVPYNPYNFRNQKWGEAMVAGAGPLANIIIALFLGLFLRFGSGVLPTEAVSIMLLIVFINVLLALFNMLPIPPLDGSKVFVSLLPYHLAHRFETLQSQMAQYGILTTIAFIFIFFYFLAPIFFRIILTITALITGFSVTEVVNILL